jgi:feruloyl-CoA synthase
MERVLLMAAPPAIDAHEVTDKGSINQRAVLRARADLVELVYADPQTSDVLTAAGRAANE